MEEEFDEFGIPIKKKVENNPAVDEFGIPLKKKEETQSTSPSTELASDPVQEVGSSVGIRYDNPVVEFIKNPPVTVSNPESEAGKEYLAIKQEYENRPPMQVNHDDLLTRISKLQPKLIAKKSALELQAQDVNKVRKDIESAEAKANALSKVTGKDAIDILKGNENYKQLKLKETRIKGNDFITTFGSNLFNGSAGISGTPSAIVESLGRLMVGSEDYEKIPESDRENFFSELLSNIPINNLNALGKVSLSGNKRQKELITNSEQLREIATKYDSAITEDLNVFSSDSNIKQAAKRIAVEGVGSIPSLIQAVIPYVGIASIVTGSAANKLEENKDSKGIGKDDVVDAWINGASEGLLEVISKGLATKMFKSFGPMAKEEAKTLSKSLVDNLIYSPLKEGGSEAATEIVNKLSDAFVLGNEQDIQENVYQILDSFAIGGFVGGSMGSVTAIGENMKLHKKAIDGDVDSQMKIEQISLLETNIEASKKSIENVNNDENLSEGEKNKLVTELEDAINKNTSSIEEILGVESKKDIIDAKTEENATETEKPTVEEAAPKPEAATKENEINTPQTENTSNSRELETNEAVSKENTSIDGDTTVRDNTNIQETEGTDVQSTIKSDPVKSENTIKRVNPKGVKGEFDVELDNSGSVKSIKSKDGREVPKFVERKVKKTKQNPTGVKAVKNANYSRIEAEAIGAKTDNEIREQETKVVNEAVASFEPSNEYEAALHYMANGGKVKLSDAKSQGQGAKGGKWAAGFNQEESLPSIERASEIISESLGLENIDQQVVRDELESIIRENGSIDEVRKKLMELRNEKEIESQESELNAYLNSLSEQDFAKFEAQRVEDDYINELSNEEALEYLEQQYGKQGQEAIENEQGIQNQPTSVQERTGEKKVESKSTESERSKLDQFSEFLKKADQDLKKFGDETLGVNLPIAIARTAVKAMIVAAKTAKTTIEVIEAGLEAVKKTSWYQKLNPEDKSDINENTLEGLIRGIINETNNISPEDAKSKAKAIFKKSDEALETKRTFKEKKKKAVRTIIEKYSDRQFVPKKLVDEAGMNTVKDLMINSHGASGKALRLFEDAYSKIYSKLNTKDRNDLDEIIQLRRFEAIDSARAKKNLPEIIHPGYIDGVVSKKALEQYEVDLGSKKFKDLNNRASEYFKVYSEILKDVFDNGLISKETYDSLNGLDYQPRLFIEHITDYEGNVSLGMESSDKGDTGGLSKDQINSLKEGSEGSLVKNSEWLLSTSIVGRMKAIAMNNVNKEFITKEFPKAKERFAKLNEDVKNKENWTKEDARFFDYFTELDSRIKDNPIIGTKKSGKPKFKYDKTPKNFKKAYFYENGVRGEFFIEEQLHNQWFDNFSRIPSTWKEAISIGSGSALLKGIATGNNPAFAIVNTPRDFMFNVVFSDQYSDFVLKGMYQVAKDTFKAIKEIKKSGKDNAPNNLFKKYIEYGGDMAFLSTQGRLKKDTELGKLLDKSIGKKTRDIAKGIFDSITLKKISNYSEIMFRMALFSRSINNQLKEKGYKSIDEVLDKKELDEIYNHGVANARSLLDFNQGGTVVKDLESAIPYLNTAVQGSRVAADAFAKNPESITLRVLQTGALASSAAVGISFLLISALKEDEDEDKTSLEIYLDAQEGISQYQRLQYFNIVTGRKNDEGEYQIIKFAKNQQLAPILSISDNIINHKISDIVGREKKSTKQVYQEAWMAFNTNISPIDITSPSGTITRTPVLKSILTYATGYDFYREQPLSNDIGRVEKGAEGQTSSSIEPFYKELGREYGISAARSKGAIESLITTPNTNPFIGLLYSGAEYATTDKDLSESTKDFAKNFGKSFLKRMESHTSEFNRSFNKNKEFLEEENKARLEGDFKAIDIKILADKRYENEISLSEMNKAAKDFDAKDKEKLFTRIQDLNRLSKVVDRNIIDIKYESDSRVRALMIWNRYGDVFDGSKDSQKIIKQMALAKGILTPDVMLEYNKIKKSVKEKTNPK